MTELMSAQGTQLLLDRPAPLLDLGARAHTNHRHVVTAARRLDVLLEVAEEGRLDGSLHDLAAATGCAVEKVRHAVASLDPVDHLVTADVRRISDDEPFGIAWAPVTAVVDLLLDWDLLTLDMAVSELSEWLGVSLAVACRAVAELAKTPGVTVREAAHEGRTFHIAIALDCCPLTAEVPAIAG
jgi:hypothetical protein